MASMFGYATIKIQVNEKLYLKDPESSELGRNIINSSIALIDRIGFENFNFKKLATEINSTEASVYRYFENKHKLLTYLVSWYWAWLEYRLDYNTHNIEDPERKLRVAISNLSEAVHFDPHFSHIDEEALYRIVVAESSKSFLTKEVGQANREGYYASYKSLCRRVTAIVEGVNPEFPFTKALVTTIIDTAHQQKFLSENFPSLTELKVGQNGNQEIQHYLETIIFKLLA